MDQFGDVRDPRAQLGSQTRVGQLQDVGFATRRVNGPLPLFPSGVRFGQLNFPVLLMNLPLSLSAQIPNNASMEDRSPSEREICLDRAIAQFLRLYKHVAQHAMVYLLPSTRDFRTSPTYRTWAWFCPIAKKTPSLFRGFGRRLASGRTGLARTSSS